MTKRGLCAITHAAHSVSISIPDLGSPLPAPVLIPRPAHKQGLLARLIKMFFRL